MLPLTPPATSFGDPRLECSIVNNTPVTSTLFFSHLLLLFSFSPLHTSSALRSSFALLHPLPSRNLFTNLLLHKALPAKMVNVIGNATAMMPVDAVVMAQLLEEQKTFYDGVSTFLAQRDSQPLSTSVYASAKPSGSFNRKVCTSFPFARVSQDLVYLGEQEHHQDSQPVVFTVCSRLKDRDMLTLLELDAALQALQGQWQCLPQHRKWLQGKQRPLLCCKCTYLPFLFIKNSSRKSRQSANGRTHLAHLVSQCLGSVTPHCLMIRVSPRHTTNKQRLMRLLNDRLLP